MTNAARTIATNIAACLLLTQVIACAPGCSFLKDYTPPTPNSVPSSIALGKAVLAISYGAVADLRKLNDDDLSRGINKDTGKEVIAYLDDAKQALDEADRLAKTGDLTNADKALTTALEALNAGRRILNEHGGKV